MEYYKLQMKRLVDVFGDKYFPEEKQKIIWEKCKLADETALERAISKIILEKVHVPAASEILAALSLEGRSEKKNEMEFFNFDCSMCGQSGFVEAKHKETGYKCAFKCPCEWFTHRAKGDFIVWDYSLEPHYTPHFYSSLSRGAKPYKIMHKGYAPTEEQKKALESFFGKV